MTRSTRSLRSVLEGPCREALPTELDGLWRAVVQDLLITHNITHVELPMSPRDSYGEWMTAAGRSSHDHLDPNSLSNCVARDRAHRLGLPSHDPSPDAPGAVRLFTNEAAVWEWAIERAPTALSNDAETKILALLFSDYPGVGLNEARARIRECCAGKRDSASS